MLIVKILKAYLEMLERHSLERTVNTVTREFPGSLPCRSRECVGHPRKGAPEIGNVDYAFNVGL